jgi:hypothetical protein
MPLAGVESAVPASQQPKTNALDSAATGIGMSLHSPIIFYSMLSVNYYYIMSNELKCANGVFVTELREV